MAPIHSLQDTAYEQIKNMIISGNLVAGVNYSLAGISNQLGMSKTPVRDALRLLAQEDYVEILPSRGIQVRTLSEKDIYELYQLRCAIESYCCRFLAERTKEPPVKDTLKLLRSILKKQTRLLQKQPDTQTIEAFYTLDRQFHSAILEGVGNPYFITQNDTCRGRIRQFVITSLQKPGMMEQTVSEHGAVCDAIAAADGVAAAAAMITHLNTALRNNLL